MKYDSPELRERLAGEYALGTLTGAARRRFERLLVEDAHLRAALRDWEGWFAAWAGAVPRAVPPSRVWRRIKSRIKARPAPHAFWSGAGFWQACTGLAAAALVAVVVWWQLVPAPAPAPVEMAVVTSEAGKPVWVVSVKPARHTLRIKVAGNQAAPPSGKTYELWMLPRRGGAPVSMGLLPARGVTTRELTGKQAQAIASAKGLAVSIEPPGGSPTGKPTGPVVYTAPLVQS
jgi:anti-sigma-K factor RskA